MIFLPLVTDYNACCFWMHAAAEALSASAEWMLGCYKPTQPMWQTKANFNEKKEHILNHNRHMPRQLFCRQTAAVLRSMDGSIRKCVKSMLMHGFGFKDT